MSEKKECQFKQYLITTLEVFSELFFNLHMAIA